MNVVEIRRLTPSDADAAIKVLKGAIAASRVPIGPNWSDEQIREACHGLGWVLVSHGQTQALVIARDTSQAWEVEFIATHPHAQRQGLARKVLSHIQNEKPSDRELWLEVHELNLPARQLYESFGFRQVGKRPRYYSDGGAAILYSYG